MARGSSGKWFNKHVGDPYVRQAQKEQFRSRAAYKLEAIDKKDKLFKPGMVVVDLGAAPGAWSQYAKRKIGKSGSVIAIDRLPMDPIEGVDIIEGDLIDQRCLDEVQSALKSVSKSGFADLVISDIAPNITGIKERDEAAFEEIWLAIVPLVQSILRPGGYFLAKVFAGLADDVVRNELKQTGTLQVRKPNASRKESREYYILWRAQRD